MKLTTVHSFQQIRFNPIGRFKREQQNKKLLLVGFQQIRFNPIGRSTFCTDFLRTSRVFPTNPI